MNKEIVEILFLLVMLAIAFAVGFLTVYRIEKTEIYNLFAAMLIPSIVILTIWFLMSFLFMWFVYLLLILLPFMLIFAVTGGVIAHKKRKKQQSIDI